MLSLGCLSTMAWPGAVKKAPVWWRGVARPPDVKDTPDTLSISMTQPQRVNATWSRDASKGSPPGHRAGLPECGPTALGAVCAPQVSSPELWARARLTSQRSPVQSRETQDKCPRPLERECWRQATAPCSLAPQHHAGEQWGEGRRAGALSSRVPRARLGQEPAEAASSPSAGVPGGCVRVAEMPSP